MGGVTDGKVPDYARLGFEAGLADDLDGQDAVPRVVGGGLFLETDEVLRGPVAGQGFLGAFLVQRALASRGGD